MPPWAPPSATTTRSSTTTALDVRAGLGKLRYAVEQTFALLHQFERLAVRWERRLELHDTLVSLACGLICWRGLTKAHP